MAKFKLPQIQMASEIMLYGIPMIPGEIYKMQSAFCFVFFLKTVSLHIDQAGTHELPASVF
jgi:hypothetical protein